MKVKDFEQLRKMMNLTLSDADGEALNAIRMANKIIAKSNTNWDAIFRRLVTIDIESAEEAYTAPAPATAAKTSAADGERILHINKMFAEILADVKPGSSFENFVKDVKRKFDYTKQLTPGQYEAISKAYDRVKNGKGYSR